MPKFGSRSKRTLATAHADLQSVFEEVVKHFDCTILEGYRSKERQNELFDQGKSQLRYPRGKHNSRPSKAVDVTPYPIDWGDRERMTYFAGQVVATARGMGVSIRWGGDWDGDMEVKDNSFDDLVHFEIKD